MERLFPQNLEAERGLLGSILIDPTALAQVQDVLQPADFYRETHRLIYEAVLQLTERHTPADFMTVADLLERRDQLRQIGGASEITALVTGVPTSGNVVYYARCVAQAALLRRLIQVAGQIAALAYESEDADAALSEAEQLLFAIRQTQLSRGELVPIEQIMSEYLETLEERSTETLTGVPTGLQDLDAVLGGLQRSDLIILAGRPGTGKTSLALNMAYHAAYETSVRRQVAFFSLEMGKRQLAQRLISIDATIDQHRLRMGWIYPDEWTRITRSVGTLSEGEFWIDDTAALVVSTLRARARQLKAQGGLDLIIVDYLQLARASIETKRYQNREQEIAEISRGLKALAKELDVPVLALAQLSRAVEQRASKVPQLSDLRESGSIENDADVVLFIAHEERAEEDQGLPTAQLIIAKHRNGPVGFVELLWEPALTRFRTLEISPLGEEGDQA